MEEKSLFIEFMGDSPTVKVLDYLLTERNLDFSISDLARNAAVGRTTLYRIWEKLIEKQIIIPTRIIGKSKLYKLNSENLAVKKLIEIDNTLSLEDLKKRSDKQQVKLPA